MFDKLHTIIEHKTHHLKTVIVYPKNYLLDQSNHYRIRIVKMCGAFVGATKIRLVTHIAYSVRAVQLKNSKY